MNDRGAKIPRVGPRRQATEEWKERVRRRLADMGHDHRWLEAQIIGRRGQPAGRGAVTKLLAPGEHTSGLVDPICQLLGIDPPVAEVSDPEEFRLLAGFRRLPADQRRHLLGLISANNDEKKN